ncbi:MAG TPA: serine hydrolase domain-containing protein [Hyphomonadaceae bacterium]|nr:serine hydrolase domain-containing protein [Hyphomonadaceae bacterium]
MTPSRRTLLAGAGALAVVGAINSATAKTRGAAPGPWGPAADYSSARRGVSLLVMKAGQVLFEDYPNAGGPDKAWELASGTKSFTGVMAAAATSDGLLTIDEPCARTLPEWQGDPRKSRITIRHLLTLTSGLEGEGAIGRPPPYLEALKAKAIYEPGTKFEYGPTNFQIFGEIMKRKLRAAGKPSDPVVWLQARVLDGIGVHPAEWQRGRDGNPFLPQGAHLTAHDWARFGQWVLDGAKGVDHRVCETLFESTKANPGYGLSWWLLRPGLIGPSPRAGIDGEAIGAAAQNEDIVMAAGAGDQRLYLLRKRGLIIVRQANQILRSMGPFATKWRDDEFLKLLPL